MSAALWGLGGLVAALLVALGFKQRAKQRADDREAVAAAQSAADDIKRIAEQRRVEAEHAAQVQQAAVPSQSNAQLEEELNK